MRIKTEALGFRELIRYPDLTFESGAVHFITGESGSGKSTLLKLLNNTVSQDHGQIILDNRPIEEWDPILLRQKVSLVAQEAWVFPGTILDNFQQFHSLRGLEGPSEIEVEEICQLCRLEFPLNHDVSNLSGGERHRLFIALFLILKPDVLMLDEPTAALDEKNTQQVIGNVIDFCKANGMTLLIVSHDLAVAREFSESTIELQKGGA